MKQSRVSAMEQPGAVNFNLETLIRSAAAFGVGLTVQLVPFSEMLAWENNFNQTAFAPVPISQDHAFLHPTPSGAVIPPTSTAALSGFALRMITAGANYHSGVPSTVAASGGAE